MDASDLDLIDDYLAGKLSEDDRAAFEYLLDLSPSAIEIVTSVCAVRLWLGIPLVPATQGPVGPAQAAAPGRGPTRRGSPSALPSPKQ